MRDGRARVCVATDVAARGIDLPGLELVIHADLPTNSETLLHRSGRTGRAGSKGISALIVPVSQRRKAERLLLGAKIEPTWANPPSADAVIERDEERLFANPIFTEVTTDEDELALIAKLTERFDAQKLAAAFVSMYRGKNSAPEEISVVSLDGARKPREGQTGDAASRPLTPRGDFGPAVWFSLSVGRKQRAEPRWLIPTICKSGDLSKNEIGAIKMQADETFVEISAAHAERFMAKLGKDRMMERGIRVTKLDGAPDFSKFSRGTDDEGFTQRDGPRMDKPWKDKPFKKDGAFKKDGPRGDKPYGDKPFRDGDAPRKDWKPKNKANEGFKSEGYKGDKVKSDRAGDDKPWKKKTGDAPAGDSKPFAKKGKDGGKPGFDKGGSGKPAPNGGKFAKSDKRG